MKRFLVVLSIVTTGAVGVWYLEADRGGSRQTGDSSVERSPGVETVDSRRVNERRAESAPTEEAQAPDAELKIVDAKTKQPVPFAEVFVFDRGKLQSQEVASLRRQGFDIVEIVTRLGQRFEADASGVAHWTLAPGDRLPLIVARKDDRIYIGRPPWDRTVEIRRPDLCVRVVDPSRKPFIGAPVVVNERHAGWPDWTMVEMLTAAPEAIADFRSHLFDYDRAEEYFVTFGWPLDPGDPVAFRRDSLPRDPVRLTLKDWGSIRVEVREPSGKPATRGTCVLELPNEKMRRRLEPQESDRETISAAQDWPHHVPLDGGAGVITPVGLGHEFSVRVEVPGWSPALEVVQGPTRIGETVTKLFVLRPEPAFVGRIVDAAGQPFRDAECLMATWEMDSLKTLINRCDEEGRFRYPYPSWYEGQESWLMFAVSQGEGNGWALHGGRLKVPRSIECGDHDLGDVRIDTNDVVASGVVLGPTEQPLSGAMVSIETPDWGRDWVGPFQAYAETDASGRFLVTGGFEGVTRFRIAVSSDGILDAFECDRGSRDLILRPKALGTLSALVEIDEQLADARLELRIRRTGEEEARAELKRPERSLLEYSDLVRAGTYQVTVVGPDLPEPLVTVPDVVVSPGDKRQDPRLHIDLRSRVRSVTLSINCEDCPFANPVGWRATSSGFLRVPASGKSSASKLCRLPVLLLDGAPADVVVSCDYMRCLRVEGLRDDREVRMQPGPAVTVFVEDLPQELRDGEEIWATPYAAERTQQPAVYGSRSSGIVDGKTSFTAAHVGPHRLLITIGTSLDMVNGRGASWALPDPFIVEDQPTQTVHLKFDRAAWDLNHRTESRPSRR